jgi:hypothetical protein
MMKRHAMLLELHPYSIYIYIIIYLYESTHENLHDAESKRVKHKLTLK